jgi:phage gp16-like protein
MNTNKQIPPAPPLSKGGISPRQIKIIHTIKGKLGLDDAAYRTLLRGYAVQSSKELTWREAEELIEELNRKAGNPPLSPLKVRGEAEGRGVMRYSDLDNRPGMCNGKQARMIEAMWMAVSRMATAEEKQSALWSFMRRICGVDHFRFLKSYQVQKVVKAIETMKS